MQSKDFDPIKFYGPIQTQLDLWFELYNVLVGSTVFILEEYILVLFVSIHMA